MPTRLVTTILIPILLVVTTIVVIALARGWRFNPQDREFSPTGILSATSEPDGAQVFVNGKFTGATNSNISLTPDWYNVSISKEGYFPWERKVRLQGEVVVKTDAVLFLRNPSLSPLTATGVSNPILSPDGTEIAYIASPSATASIGQSVFEEELTRPTLFVYDLSYRALPFSKNPRPYEGTLTQLLNEWDTEATIAREVSLRKMPKEFTTVATNSMKLLSFSPDDTKVFYEATVAATLARAINPAFVGVRETPEERELTTGAYYVYDVKEDRNYNVTSVVGSLIAKTKTPTPTPKPTRKAVPTPSLTREEKLLIDYQATLLPVFWLGTSRHLVLVDGSTIGAMEFDGSNKVTVYAGPFENGYVFPHPSGRQVIIMTTFNPAFSPIPSLYTLNIR